MWPTLEQRMIEILQEVAVFFRRLNTPASKDETKKRFDGLNEEMTGLGHKVQESARLLGMYCRNYKRGFLRLGRREPVTWPGGWASHPHWDRLLTRRDG